MAFQRVPNVSLRGLSACVPANVERNVDMPFYSSKQEAEDVIKSIGIIERHVAPKGVTASDLCCAAAEKLIEALGWAKESIDILAFCTQSPDYINQPTAFIAHERLGLPETTMCLDFFHGCPGWVVSLSAVCSMLQTGVLKRALLLVGDTQVREIDRLNREESPLFGDAGTATALEYDANATPIFFNIGTLSTDGKALIRKHGGFRNPFTVETLQHELARKAGLLRDDNDSKMDSMDVFSFAITKVPKALKKLCEEYGIEIERVDNLLLHQANKVIIDTIAKRMKIAAEKVPIGLTHYGNTTSASIPLTMITERVDVLGTSTQRNLLCAFGTGLAWGAAYIETEKLICLPVIILE